MNDNIFALFADGSAEGFYVEEFKTMQELKYACAKANLQYKYDEVLGGYITY